MADSPRILRNLAGRWWLVLLAVLVGAGAGAGYAFTAPPGYTAPAYVVVSPAGDEPNPDEGVPVNFAQAYGRIAGQPQVLAPAAAALHVPLDKLRKHVDPQTSPDAPIVQIDGNSGTARSAADDANATARALVALANKKTAATRVKLSVLSSATPPSSPSSPSKPLDIGIGAAAGLLIGALAGLVRSTPDRPAPDRPAPDRPAPVPAGGPEPTRGTKPDRSPGRGAGAVRSEQTAPPGPVPGSGPRPAPAPRHAGPPSRIEASTSRPGAAR